MNYIKPCGVKVKAQENLDFLDKVRILAGLF